MFFYLMGTDYNVLTLHDSQDIYHPDKQSQLHFKDEWPHLCHKPSTETRDNPIDFINNVKLLIFNTFL